MKSMSIAALLFVIFLGALFVYVAEDIPAFGDANSAPNRYVWLFDMDAEGIEDDLNQGNIPASLGDKLENSLNSNKIKYTIYTGNINTFIEQLVKK